MILHSYFHVARTNYCDFLELLPMYIHLASEQFSKIYALQLPYTVSPWMNSGEEGERGEIREEEEEDEDDDEQEEQKK